MEEKMGRLSKPGDQEVCCDTVSPRMNGEATLIVFQQSSCPEQDPNNDSSFLCLWGR